MTRFRIIRRWFIRLRSGGIIICSMYSRFWSIVRIRWKEIIGKGRSRVPDLREKGGDKDAILERSSSSGLIVAIFVWREGRNEYFKG